MSGTVVVAGGNRAHRTQVFVAFVIATTACASPAPNGVGTQTPGPVAQADASQQERPLLPLRPVTLWDGEEWEEPLTLPITTCSDDPCETSLKALRGAGRDGSIGVRFRLRGKGYVSASWRVDGMATFKLDDALTLWLRVQTPSPSDAPPPEGTRIALFRGGGQMQTSRKVRIHDCVPDFADGLPHRVVVPIAALYRPGDGFNPQIAEGISVHVFSGTTRTFHIDVDDVKLEHIDSAAAQSLCRPMEAGTPTQPSPASIGSFQ